MEEKMSFPDPKVSPMRVGIDFGTCNCCAAVYKKGHVEFLKIGDKEILPSVVTFGVEKTPLIGDSAKRCTHKHPEKTIQSIKMELGNPDWKFTHDDKVYTPTDITALILGYLLEQIQNQSDVRLDGSVKRVTLCVPANFESNKCQELKHAAVEMLGIDDVRLLEEPVAAAIAWGFQKDLDVKILVYDLGGGTFDVCVLQVRGSSSPDIADRYQVLAKGGIGKLGGDDFDKRLMMWFGETIKDTSGIDVFDLEKDQGVSPNKIKAAQQILKELAEQAKINLSVAESFDVSNPSIITDESGKAYGLELQIDRTKFLELIGDRPDLIELSKDPSAKKMAPTEMYDLLDLTRKEVHRTLQEAGLGLDDIDRVILVGGSTMMHGVKDMIKEMFGKSPYSDLDPRTIVARGAAIYGAGGILEQNRTSHYLGVELLNQRFGKLIDKNAPLPAVMPKPKEYQAVELDPEAIRITVFQSMKEIEYTTDESAVCLGEFHLVIPEDKRKKEYRDVRVSMEVTEENLLKVRAELADETGVFEEVEIRK